jgi:hypothetical protein
MTPERRMRLLIGTGTVLLGTTLGLRLLLPHHAPVGATVSRENGVSVLRDADGELLLDPWKHPYVYLEPTSAHPRPRVVSLGADGKLGGSGDDADVDSDELASER